MRHRRHGSVGLRGACWQLQAVQLLCGHCAGCRVDLRKAVERVWKGEWTGSMVVKVLLLGHHFLLLDRQIIDCMHQLLQLSIHRI